MEKETSNISTPMFISSSSIDVSVIVVNYNTCKMTSECIDSLFVRTKNIKFEVILVDNASTDGSKEYFEGDERIRYVYNYENIGFGRANNLGMTVARGKYFFLLNSDTLLVNNAIKMFFDYAEANVPVAFYGCWLENNDGTYIHSCANLPTMKSLLNNAISPYKSKIKIDNVTSAEIPYCEDLSIKVGYITGADLFLHHTIFEKIGGFDHQFFMYYEESDWQRRSMSKGIFSYCINGPRIKHLVGGSQNKQGFNFLKSYYNFMSSSYYVYKHFGRINYFVYRIAYACISLPVICFSRSLSFSNRLQFLSLICKSYISLITKSLNMIKK